MLIVVDGGASRCRAAAFDEDGRRHAELSLDAHASLSLGVAAAAATVRSAVAAVARRLDRPCGWRPGRLVLGLAGSLGEARRAEFRACLPDDLQVDILTDGQAQLLGATGGRAGACLAVGTGSVIHWRDADGRLGMAGGWGFPVGDEASAAWLGVELLRAYVAARDAGEHGAPLFVALEARIGSDVGAVQRWTTCTVSNELGQLATLVSEAADAGDAVAQGLIARGAEQCLSLYARAPADLPRWLVGGLAAVYAPVLHDAGVALQPVHGDALDGLYRHASRSA